MLPVLVELSHITNLLEDLRCDAIHYPHVDHGAILLSRDYGCAECHVFINEAQDKSPLGGHFKDLSYPLDLLIPFLVILPLAIV
jgi:hypothetical protein